MTASPISRRQRMAWPTTSRGLIDALRDPRRSAEWERFERDYGAIVRIYCRRRGLQPADADDIVQKVLLDVCGQMSRFKYQPEKGRFRSWFATITGRAVWRFQNRMAKTLEKSTFALDRQGHSIGSEWLDDFGAAVMELAQQRIRSDFSEREWLAFEKNWYQDQSAAVIACESARNVTWVYQTKFKIVKRLEQEVSHIVDDLPIADG